MDRFFESKPVVYMSKFFDMVLLNVIFVISCIPIVTIGAACTALYYTCVKVIRRDRSKLWKEYKQSFVDNFKTSVGIWIPLVLTETALAVVTYRLLSQGHTSMSAAMIGICMAFFLFILAIMIYSFAVLSRFTVSAKEAIRNATVISIHHGGETTCHNVCCGLEVHAIDPADHAIGVYTADLIFYGKGFDSIYSRGGTECFGRGRGSF